MKIKLILMSILMLINTFCIAKNVPINNFKFTQEIQKYIPEGETKIHVWQDDPWDNKVYFGGMLLQTNITWPRDLGLLIEGNIKQGKNSIKIGSFIDEKAKKSYDVYVDKKDLENIKDILKLGKHSFTTDLPSIL